MGRRLAILKVTRQQLRREIRPENYLLIEHDLKLPDNALITGISEHLLFDEDLVAVKIECPDFREVQDGEKIPFVEMLVFEHDKSFARWAGPGISGGALPSPAVPMKPDTFIVNCGTHAVTGSTTNNLGAAVEGTRICICPAADMLADEWKCTCGAVK